MLKLWYLTWIFPVIKTFHGYHYFLSCDPDLGVSPIFENFNLANNFWTVNASALIFHMSIPCDKTFPWVPLFWTLWPWPWILIHFLKTLTLPITFEQWVREIWYFTWIFPVKRHFRGYDNFFLVTLILESEQFKKKNLTLPITFVQWLLELWYFTLLILVTRPFRVFYYFWHCDLDLGVRPTFRKL